MLIKIFRFIPAILLAIGIVAMPMATPAGVRVSITIAPPVIPVYVQPVCPGDGYIWVPGYWSYGSDGYFWVPGTWVLPPVVGFYWTPGYWGWADGAYLWHAGYWGPEVGFYGGINYGFGYFGVGFAGGYWHGGHFYYNTAVTRVNTTIVHNTYSKTVINNTTANKVSFNEGPSGTKARPTSAEMAAARAQHRGPTSSQREQEHRASTDRAQLVAENRGKPAVTATEKPGEFNGRNALTSKSAGSSSRTEPSRNNESTRSPKSESTSAPEHESAPATRHESTPAPKHESAPATRHESTPAPKHESAPARSHETPPAERKKE
jgi:hypothetical protein